MENQISSASAESPAPAFYYNLGDMVYFNGGSNLYNSHFYESYQNYYAAIFAIAGTDDGDTSTRPCDLVDTEPSLFSFMRNFCDTASHYDRIVASTASDRVALVQRAERLTRG
jgi:hypothetical protein